MLYAYSDNAIFDEEEFIDNFDNCIDALLYKKTDKIVICKNMYEKKDVVMITMEEYDALCSLR